MSKVLSIFDIFSLCCVRPYFYLCKQCVMLLKASFSKHISIWITLITNLQSLSLSVVTDKAVVNVNSGFYLLNWFNSGLLLVLTVCFHPGCKHYKTSNCATFKTGSTAFWSYVSILPLTSHSETLLSETVSKARQILDCSLDKPV